VQFKDAKALLDMPADQ